jgi:hypothetical protein
MSITGDPFIASRPWTLSVNPSTEIRRQIVAAILRQEPDEEEDEEEDEGDGNGNEDDDDDDGTDDGYSE